MCKCSMSECGSACFTGTDEKWKRDRKIGMDFLLYGLLPAIVLEWALCQHYRFLNVLLCSSSWCPPGYVVVIYCNPTYQRTDQTSPPDHRRYIVTWNFFFKFLFTYQRHTTNQILLLHNDRFAHGYNNIQLSPGPPNYLFLNKSKIMVQHSSPYKYDCFYVNRNWFAGL